MALNALFTRRALGLTVAGLGASYLLLKTANPRPQGQQKPTGDYRVETHRSGSPVAESKQHMLHDLIAVGVIEDADEQAKGENDRVLGKSGQSRL